MLVAVLSDIHGNRHALEAVLDDARSADVDETWCLGDVVGYGAEPDACCELVREHARVCLSGNHDLAVTGAIDTAEFSPGAALAAEWTAEVLSDENRAWLSNLLPRGSRGGIGLYHGSPRDPVWEYVISTLLAELCLDAQEERVALIGHSHIALSFHRPEGEPAGGARRLAGETADLAAGGWLLNPGSVGQPRDGDPDASWLLLDLDAASATWRRTSYDVAGAAAAIRSARLPSSLAERLQYGQ